jgi:4-amino-4-deoxy-L-arabinose transferase-like glycosyltransferase
MRKKAGRGNKKWLFIFILLFLFALFLRIPNLNFPFFGDEAWHEFVKFNKGGFPSVHYDSIKSQNEILVDPPLTGWFYLLYSSIFGFSTVILRSTSLLFALINILLVYFLAKKIFNKKTALFSVFLIAFSYWHCFESYILDRDGNFLMFFYLILIVLYVFYRETKERKFLWTGAIISMIYVLIKISGVLILGVIGLMILYDNKIFSEIWKNRFNVRTYDVKKFKKSLFEMLPFIILNILAYLLLFEATAFFNYPYYELLHMQEALSFEFFTGGFAQSLGREIIYLLLYGSPLLIGLTLLSLTKFNKKKLLFLFWILVPIIIYSKVPYAGALERYLSVIIPALCILGGNFLSEIKWDRTYKKILVIGGLFYFILLNLFSFMKFEYLMHSIKEYFIRAATFNWDFLFPFYGAGGPAFLLPFWAIAVSIWLSFIFLTVSIMFYKKKKIFYFCFISFLAISGAFSLYVLQEFNFSLHTPSVNRGFNELLDELNYETSSVVYTNIGAIRIYHDDSIKFVPLRCPKKNTLCLDKYGELIRRFGGAAYIIDFPKRFENSQYYDLLEDNCELREKITDNEAVLGYIYDCKKQL